MPLPKPPARPGDLLPAGAFEAQAAPKADKRSLKPRAAAADVPSQGALDLHEGANAPGARATTSPMSNSTARLLQPAVPTAPARPAAAPRAFSPPQPAVAALAPLPGAAARAAAPSPRPRKTRTNGHAGPAKLFVLDTNVLMHDPSCLFRFEEHDVFLPMITLEELDDHKKGMSEVARNARQVSRELDALVRTGTLGGHDGLPSSAFDPKAGIELAKTGHREAGGKLFFQTTLLDIKLPDGLPQGKADNQILGVVQTLREY